MAAQGAIIEPFVYVGVLWFLRDQPLWFGVVLAIGTLNREFTLYAVPALLLVQLLQRKPFPALARQWLLTFATFFIVWESVEALKPRADLMGPGTRGQLIQGFSGSQVDNLLNRFDWSPGQLATRVTNLGAGILTWFSGARQLEPRLPLTPHPWLAGAIGIGLLLASLRAVFLLPGHTGRAEFAIYLFAVGVVAVVVYISAKPSLDLGYSRYALLGLLAPVGLMGALIALEPRPLIRRAAIAGVVSWAALMAVDHATVLIAYERQAPPNPKRQLADYFVAKGIDTAAGDYWRAYEVTFLARERVRIASEDFIRIEEYQQLYSERQRPLVIRENPCPNGDAVGGMYVCAQ